MTRETLPREADVVVVGGGICGCSAAYHLAKAGKHVALLEARNIASGASGRNGGQVIQLDGRDTDAASIMNRLRYSRENNRMLRRFPAELGMGFEHVQIGSLDVASSEEEWEQISRIFPLQRAAGDTEVQLLDRKALRDLVPTISGHVWGARLRPSDGTLNPFLLTHAFARAALRWGAKLFTHTKVDEIVVKRGRVSGVRVGKHVIATDWALNATNAWAKQLTPELEVIPLRALAIVTERVAPLSVVPFEAVLDGQIIFGTTQTGAGNLLVGGPPGQAATMRGQYEETVSPAEVINNSAILAKMLPPLRDVHVIRCWCGAMGSTADGLPCVGPMPGVKGLVICAGFPNGMAFTPILSKLATEYILTQKPSMPLDLFRPGRFGGKRIPWPKRYNYTVLAEFLSRA